MPWPFPSPRRRLVSPLQVLSPLTVLLTAPLQVLSAELRLQTSPLPNLQTSPDSRQASQQPQVFSPEPRLKTSLQWMLSSAAWRAAPWWDPYFSIHNMLKHLFLNMFV